MALTHWHEIAQRTADKLDIPRAEVERTIKEYTRDHTQAMNRLESPEYDYFYIAKMIPIGSAFARLSKKCTQINSLWTYYRTKSPRKPI